MWTGNQDCEPVTWKECRLVPQVTRGAVSDVSPMLVQVQSFSVPRVDCKPGEKIPYNDYVEESSQRMVTKLVCRVEAAPTCRPVTSQSCTTLTYQATTTITHHHCSL